MSTSAGGSSPLVSRAWRCGIGGEMLCLLTTLSRYLQRSKDSSLGLHQPRPNAGAEFSLGSAAGRRWCIHWGPLLG